MDRRKCLIYDRKKNEDLTGRVKSIEYDDREDLYHITFSDNKAFPYSCSRIFWSEGPKEQEPSLYRISSYGTVLDNIQNIFAFDEYWRIFFSNGTSKVYLRSDLEVVESCLREPDIQSRLEYLRKLACIRDEGSTEGISLFSKYEKLTFVDRNSALAIYLSPEKYSTQTYACDTVIFPFGGNASQFRAVRNALENQISVIQGPPGTGKTQTILNIVANLLINNRTMEIVSNNESAIENVLEKLASPQYGLDFLAALLGKGDNETAFIENQTGEYPDLSKWAKPPEELMRLKDSIACRTEELSSYFEKQERLACAKQESAALDLEEHYFEQYCREFGLVEPRKPTKELKSERILQILQECERLLEVKESVSFWHKVKNTFIDGLFEWNYYKNDISTVVTYLQRTFYRTRREELKQEIEELQCFLDGVDAVSKMNNLTQSSMEYLRGKLYERYGGKSKRIHFKEDDLRKKPASVLQEYPIVLSTAFSSRRSLNVTYDYVIMDEASQADIATGALPLAGGRNAVIVGDLKQLGSIVKEGEKIRCREVLAQCGLPVGYSNADYNILSSVCAILPNSPQTLLREHYRCHPKIIGF